MKSLLLAALCGIALSTAADERVTICFNYGCLSQAEVVYAEARLVEVGAPLAAARDAREERAALGPVIGRLLGWAAEQTPVGVDRGGNFDDGYISGRMDCIDHSLTTTRLLALLERRGWLRHHKVVDRVHRGFIINEHWSAQIEQTDAVPAAGEAAPRFAVDAWFFDNGQPAAVMPVAAWRSGEDPRADWN